LRPERFQFYPIDLMGVCHTSLQQNSSCDCATPGRWGDEGDNVLTFPISLILSRADLREYSLKTLEHHFCLAGDSEEKLSIILAR
jgi:hypothetical protein